MTEAERYDAVVIGSGEGGKYLAWDMAQAGQKVARQGSGARIGGLCPNINCLPSKNEIWSAGVARYRCPCREYGVVAGPVSVDMKMQARKRAMVESLVAFHPSATRRPARNSSWAMHASSRLGRSRCLERRRMRRPATEKLFLNGDRMQPFRLFPASPRPKPLTHIEALELDRLPAHLIVLGGGYGS